MTDVCLMLWCIIVNSWMTIFQLFIQKFYLKYQKYTIFLHFSNCFLEIMIKNYPNSPPKSSKCTPKIPIFNLSSTKSNKTLLGKDESQTIWTICEFLTMLTVCIGVSTPPPSKTRPLLSCEAPLKSANSPSPPF